MDAETVLKGPAIFGSARIHIVQNRFGISQCVRPHQIHIGSLSGHFTGIFGKTAKIEIRRLARKCGDAGRRQVKLEELTGVLNRLAIHPGAQDLHRF